MPDTQRVARASTRRGFSSFVSEVSIIAVFLCLAAWFWFGPRTSEIPLTPAAIVDPADIQFGPLRVIQSARPVIDVAGFKLNCMECHRHFVSPIETPRTLTQHQDIVLNHGLNDRCLNCHDREDRSRLALRGDRTIPFDEVARLCAKCHGPTYRDWQLGMHGKTTVTWNAATGGQRRLRCSECHDPHSPSFDPMRLLPGPRTLRMGGPPAHGEDDPLENIDPLRKWAHPEGDS